MYGAFLLLFKPMDGHGRSAAQRTGKITSSAGIPLAVRPFVASQTRINKFLEVNLIAKSFIWFSARNVTSHDL
jgi:hypothetical protein